jgi:hypothetical protein
MNLSLPLKLEQFIEHLNKETQELNISFSERSPGCTDAQTTPNKHCAAPST